MIITRTPLRISLVGGGTDMPAFYTQYGGAVVSMAINKYIYICVNRKFDGRMRLSYSKTENVDTPDQLKHDLARACLKQFNESGLEITSVADIPGSGTGLGSSSSYTVGLLMALSEYHKPPHWSPSSIAEDAFLVEQSCGKILGKQDHYAASYGGFHLFEFNQDGSVCVEPICLGDEQKKYMHDRMLLLWTGKTRQADKILRTQSLNLSHNAESIARAKEMRDSAVALGRSIHEISPVIIGDSLNRNWKMKRGLVQGISDEWIDGIYEKAIEAGAGGGKLCGAGGGGFLLFWVAPENRLHVIEATGLREVPFLMEEKGSTVIYNDHGIEK
jgi:D-glycero-alpha-D-manno-heptose-7-phosphate kinase